MDRKTSNGYINKKERKNMNISVMKERKGNANGSVIGMMKEKTNLGCGYMWTKKKTKQWRQGEWDRMWKTIDQKEIKWALILSNEVTENSQITYACNNGEDNDMESLGKGHSSLTHKIHNEIDTRKIGHLKANIRTLINNWLIKATLNDQYIHSMEKGTVYIHTYTHFYFYFYLRIL